MKIKNFQLNSENLISQENFSAHDIKTDVKIPNLNNELLAYETGVHIGDGSLHITKGGTHSVRFYGHGEDDWLFISEIMPRIIKQLYNKNVRAKQCSDSNKCVLNICSKAVATFKQNIGLSVGKKTMEDLPKFIKQDRKLVINCIRGIADTDFSLYFTKNEKGQYSEPAILCVMNNKELIQNLGKYLESFGFDVRIKTDIKRTRNGTNLIEHRIGIYGRKNLEKWMNLIGFSNPKHLTKYHIWKKFGYCNPKTRIDERLKILSTSSTQRVDPVDGAKEVQKLYCI